MEYYLAVKKKKILPFATVWMDLENIISEISQSEKDKYHMISLMCGIYEQTDLTSKTDRLINGEQMANGGRVGWGEVRE